MIYCMESHKTKVTMVNLPFCAYKVKWEWPARWTTFSSYRVIYCSNNGLLASFLNNYEYLTFLFCFVLFGEGNHTMVFLRYGRRNRKKCPLCTSHIFFYKLTSFLWFIFLTLILENYIQGLPYPCAHVKKEESFPVAFSWLFIVHYKTPCHCI